MRKYLLVILFFLNAAMQLRAQVKIGSPGTPNANAVLELDGGTNKGLLLPKLTASQITALTTAPDGLVIFNTTDGFLYLRKNSAWQKITDATTGGGAAFTLPYSGTASTVGGAEFSITHTTTFGDAVYFTNNVGAALTTGAGNNKLNMTGGNTGIGLPAGLSDNPTLGKLVVRGTVGAVSAMFGDNTGGVSVMNNLPSIGFNYYYNAGSKAISTGFGSALGQDPSTGRIYLSSSATSITGAGTSMPLVDRVVVLANGNTGIAAANPLATLHVGKGAGTVGGTAQFDGTTYSSHFNYSSTEETYIRGGKASSQVIINDQGTGNIRLAENGGNVGIGIATPANKLSVAANTADDAVKFFNAGAGDAVYALSTNGSAINAIAFNTAVPAVKVGGGSASIVTTGNVGIGTQTPTRPLSFPAVLEKKISLYPGATGDAGFGVFGNELRMHSDNSNADITFGYDNFTNGFSEKMRIKGNGSVGIGNSNPAFPLDLTGRIRLRHIGANNTAGIWLDGTTTALRSFIGTNDNNTMGFYGSGVGWNFLMDVTDGSIMIGTAQKAAGFKVNVAGKIIAEEVRVQLRAAWPDYVFAGNYQLMPLPQLEQFIKTNNHLPGFNKAAEIEKAGADIGDTQRKLVEKVEELTLYVIELQKQVEALKKKN